MLAQIDLWDIAIVVGELGALLISFGLFYKIVDLTFKYPGLQSLIQKFPSRSQNLQRNIKILALVLTILLTLIIIAFNGYLLIQQIDIYDRTLALAQTLPEGFWLQLGYRLLKVIGLIVAAWFLLPRLNKLVTKLHEWEESLEQIKANDESVNKFFHILRHTVRDGIWLSVIAWSSALLALPSVVSDGLFTLLKVYLIVAVGRLVVSAVAAIVDSADALIQKYTKATAFEEFYEQLRGLRHVLITAVEYIVYVETVTIAIRQISFIARYADYGAIAVQIIAVILLSRVLVEVSQVVIDKVVLKRSDRLTDIQWQKRLTLSPLIKSLLKYAIYFGSFLFILSLLNINIGPILAAVGGVGLIIGLGAQPIILDMISGLFIVFENLYLVGDYIKTGDAEGVVEAIDIRTTRLRDPDGQVHILRNGQLGDIVNYSKEYVNAAVEIAVAYDSDLDQVFAVIEAEGAKLMAGNPDVLDVTEVEGVAEFGDHALIIDTQTKSKPGRHREVAYQLRKVLKEAFAREGIKIPFHQKTITTYALPETGRNDSELE